MRLILLLAACLLVPGAWAQAPPQEPLLPRTPRVVDVVADEPAMLTLALHNETLMGDILVVVGDALLAGDEAEVALDDATSPTTWVRGRRPETLEPHGVLLRDGRPLLNATVTAGGPARLLFYYDVSCNCSNKTAPFPGAILAFHVDVIEGDGVTATIRGPAGGKLRAEAYPAVPRDPAVPAGGPDLENATLRWEAQATRRDFVLVTVVEGGGLVEVAFARVPGDAARLPSAVWTGIVALGLGAWVLRRQGRA